MYEKIKGAAKEILVLLAFTFGFVYYLFRSTRSVREENVRRDAEAAVDKTLVEKERANEVANDSVVDYERLRDEYRKGRPDV